MVVWTERANVYDLKDSANFQIGYEDKVAILRFEHKKEQGIVEVGLYAQEFYDLCREFIRIHDKRKRMVLLAKNKLLRRKEAKGVQGHRPRKPGKA